MVGSPIDASLDCATCAALAPIVPGHPQHGGGPGAGPLDLVLHGDGPAGHDFHTGRPGSFEALFSHAAVALAAGREIVVTVPLTRSVYRSISGVPLLLRARGISALRVHVPILGPEAHPTLVPRLALALPFALHALATARRLGLPAFLSGAPLCLLGPYASERIESPTRAYAAACDGCPARSACPGIDARYLEAYGDGELRRAKDAPPAPSAHPLARAWART